MSETVIKVENLSKQYRLGSVSTGTISHDLNRWWHRIRGKEDPYLKIGDVNDRTQKGSSDYVWALRDLNFEVKHGEVLGIIGRNGAGKSTLLKILSRTTAPTKGSIKIKGRVASLLEVGTGFHPELSGRENIFLNGAILGMTKNEIARKFDEIVDFAGVERYIDTPVKRYSSGMYVRLAFAVAAHLDPEILIVDEVLAVGDADFQKKCLGKMKDVSEKDGRTILFVSHNLVAMRKICQNGFYLSNGSLKFAGAISETIDKYLGANLENKFFIIGDETTTNEKLRMVKAWFDVNEPKTKPLISHAINFHVEFEVLIASNINLTLIIHSKDDEHVCSSTSLSEEGSNYCLKPGLYSLKCQIPGNFFNDTLYEFSLLFVENYSSVLFNLNKAFAIEFKEDLGSRGGFVGKWGGMVRPKWNWELKNCI